MIGRKGDRPAWSEKVWLVVVLSYSPVLWLSMPGLGMSGFPRW